jgi:hypothetical protein
VESVHNSAPREVIADSGIYRARHGNRIELVLARGHVGNTLDAVALHAANTVLREARDDDTVAGLILRARSNRPCRPGATDDRRSSPRRSRRTPSPVFPWHP